MPIAYDIGMHNGDDTHYYLSKGYDVVSVEANSALCQAAAERFASEVSNKRLTILNFAISDKRGEIDFYHHKQESEWGTIVKPEDLSEWTMSPVKTAPLSDIVLAGPEADFIKIDIEGADYFALDSLQAANRMPKSIVCEAHSLKILCKLIVMDYKRFRIVNGKSARKAYRKHKITTLAGERMPFRFSSHSSGPVGSDLPGEWYSAEQAAHLWGARALMYGHGWFDIHAER